METNDKKTILYVDDEIINLELFRINFKAAFNVLISSNPNDGLRMLEQQMVDVVVSDYKMPVMNGIEFIREVKKMYPGKNCLIISGYHESDILQPGDKNLLYGFVTKPWIRQNLLELISKAALV